MTVSREEFEVLYNIAKSRLSAPDKTASDDGMMFYEGILEALEEQGLIKIERRKDKIHGATETSQGAAVLSDPQYAEWIPD